MSRFTVPSLSLLALALAPSFAVIAAPQPDGSAQSLDTVLVTASRTEQGPATLAASTVIERAEIDRLQPRSLMDLLRGREGIGFANNGGAGKNTSIFMRGTESAHVLVLVDGVRIGSATLGTPALQDIPVDQVERIEIVRGPFSSLYGSDAIGGVIQIFTRSPEQGTRINGSVSIGSEATRRGTFGVSGRSAAADEVGGWYALQLAHERTDGIDATDEGAWGHDPDRDGYRNTSVSARGGYRFSPQWRVEGSALQAKGFNEVDSSPNESDITQRVLGGKAVFTPNEALRFTASLGHNADLSENMNDGVWASSYQTRRNTAGLQADMAVGEGLLTLGWDHVRESVGGSMAYPVERRSIRGLFGQWQQVFGAHALQASLRRDDNDQFGGETTGALAWGWELTEGLRLSARYGTAFHAPSFNQLYFPGYGNPELLPESSRSFELGLRGEQRWGGWSLSAFDTRITDMIAHDPTIGDWGGPNNINRARIKGLEAGVDTTVADWTVRLAATLLDPRNAVQGPQLDNLLPRRGKQSLRLDADRRFGAFSVGGSVFGSSMRYDDPANTLPMGGYGLVDLRAGWDFSPQWTLALAVNNIADKHYQTARFYEQPGRNWLLTLRYVQ